MSFYQSSSASSGMKISFSSRKLTIFLLSPAPRERPPARTSPTFAAAQRKFCSGGGGGGLARKW